MNCLVVLECCVIVYFSFVLSDTPMDVLFLGASYLFCCQVASARRDCRLIQITGHQESMLQRAPSECFLNVVLLNIKKAQHGGHGSKIGYETVFFFFFLIA